MIDVKQRYLVGAVSELGSDKLHDAMSSNKSMYSFIAIKYDDTDAVYQVLKHRYGHSLVTATQAEVDAAMAHIDSIHEDK